MPQGKGAVAKRASARRPAGKPRVRYAVVGLGHIAQVALLPAFRHAAENSELAALVSGDPKKREKLGRRYRVPRVYDYAEYADCLASDAIDAVYLTLPNHLHRDYAVAAAEAGKHVLCEKPLAVTEKECEEMIAAAERNSVKLMTAYRLHFESANLKAVETVQSRRLGTARIFQSLFCMQVEDEDNIRLGPTEKGGGPLYDIGIYCINASRYLFRAEPTEVIASAASNGEKRFAQSPEMMVCQMRFPDDRVGSFTCSFGAADVGWYRVVGTKGDLRLDPAYEYAQSLELSVTIGGKTRTERFPKRDQFAPELIHFSDCILRGRDPEPSGREGMADVRVIQALLRSAESGRAVRLDEFERRRRPTPSLEIQRPPVAKPRQIHVESPSGN
ncbi:MAG: Gfo/Idh/MocA family oxidoreductase [Thermoanaerobaculia bacterium]